MSCHSEKSARANLIEEEINLKTSEASAEQIHSANAKIDIRQLKVLVFEKFPACALQECLLVEQDFLDVNEFLTKLGIYLKLLRRMK
jgi:hypothetical protein